MNTFTNTITKAKHALGASLIATLGFNTSHAQSDVQLDEALFDLSLEELMEVSIESASKKKESLFDAPLASFTITAAEIEKAGISNIVEALRLAPGVIVRQQENGVYDVQIRGLDNLTRNNMGATASNTSTLVMINNRPVFNHNLGGTFWESFPIDISDIDKIEIVRGPAAPLFGPNAVTGVINFITKRPEDGRIVSARVEGGTDESLMSSVYYGNTINDEWSYFVSGNYQKRNAFDDQLFDETSNQYVSRTDLGERQALLMGDHSLQRVGFNTGAFFSPSEDVNVDLSIGFQDSEVLKNFVQSNSLGMGYGTTRSGYVNLAGSVKGFNFRTSYSNGNENMSYNYSPNEYDFSVLDTNVEYEWQVTSGLTITPGIGYIRAAFDESDYNDDLTYLAGDEQSLTTKSAYLRGDWNISDKIRLIGASRADHFSSTDEVKISYEGALTYKVNEYHIIRASVTKSNAGSFAGQSYLDTFLGGTPALGNTDLDVFTVHAAEMGYRSKIANNLTADVSLFYQKAQNFIMLEVMLDQMGFPFLQSNNAEVEAVQNGVTLSLNYVPSSNVQFKPFVMIQNTQLENVRNTYAAPAPFYQLEDADHEYTPSVVGGWFFNYSPSSKWNINLNGYYFSEQTFYGGDGSTPTTYDGKLILNLVTQYNVANNLNAFVSAKNLLGDTEREFVTSGRIDRYFGAGLSLNIK